MAKKKAKPKDNDFEKFFWFFATAYLADCVDLLSKTKKLKLAHLGEQYCGEKTWQQLVEESIGVDPTFVKTVYNLCLERGKTEAQAINFMLRGFGCPEPEERMIEVLG
jgi:hypothetical protein